MRIRYIAAALLMGAATASSAAVLVVRSSGPSARAYPPGKSLPDNARLALQANDILVVLDARGTRTLKGPGQFTPGGPAKASGTMSQLGAVTGAARGRARVGAVRSVGVTGAPKPTLWQVDVTKSSNMCVTGPTGLSLWRPDASKAMVLTVSGGRTNASRQLQWGVGQSSLAWPADLAVADNVDYRLSWDPARSPTRVQFRTLPAKPGGLEDTASTLIKNGCTAQLDLLIETAKAPEAGPASSG